jgi:hypothetical protein
MRRMTHAMFPIPLRVRRTCSRRLMGGKLSQGGFSATIF